jgi:iron(III) transport system ATP-binding protein
VLIGGKDVTLLPPNERDVGMVFQSYALFPHMSVIENVSYGLRQSQLSRQSQRDKAREGLKMVGLEGYDDRLPSELSGGQQQRVAVARALVLGHRCCCLTSRFPILMRNTAAGCGRDRTYSRPWGSPVSM